MQCHDCGEMMLMVVAVSAIGDHAVEVFGSGDLDHGSAQHWHHAVFNCSHCSHCRPDFRSDWDIIGEVYRCNNHHLRKAVRGND